MAQRALSSLKTDTAISVADVEYNGKGWLLDGEIRQHSVATTEIRRFILEKLVWYLKTNEFPKCGTLQLRGFLAYVSKGHEHPGGRWGEKHLKRAVRPRTVHTYHGHLRTFFRWLVAEGVIEASPMECIAAPIARADQIQPFAEGQIEALLREAKKVVHPRRDEAILRLLYDTGMRASELVHLRMNQLDIGSRRCTVLGKGNKHRTLYFGRQAAKALWNYLRDSPREPEEPLFYSDRGIQAGHGLTRSGLFQLIERLGKRAKVEVTRCSPHTFRHTFAVQFLRAGGNVFTLKEILGHTTLTMVNRYVAFAQADIENQHRLYAPGDRLGMARK